MSSVQDGDGLLRDDRRLHTRHGVGLDLALVERPLEELLQAAVSVVRRRVGGVVEQMHDEALDVLALDSREISRALRPGEVATQALGRLTVGLDRLRRQVTGAQGPYPAAHERTVVTRFRIGVSVLDELQFRHDSRIANLNNYLL